MQELLKPDSLSRDDINRTLKKAADLIRTRVDYKYILILLFLKRLSDGWKVEFNKAVETLRQRNVPEKDIKKLAKEDEAFHDFNYPEKYTWDKLRADINNLPINLSEALKAVAEQNPELQGVVDRLDFLEFTRHMENLEILKQLFELFSGLDLSKASPDLLGDAYEWILSYFAPQKAKEGEVYTPREVIKLLVEILDPQPLDQVYDPCFGSGGMLIASYRHVEQEQGKKEARKLFLYGQEYNRDTYAIAKMNMIIHGITSAELEIGDTLLNPKLPKGKRPLEAFKIVIANPPWNQDGYGEARLKKAAFDDERYKYGFPPNNSADWAWIQHMIASAKEDGKVGIVIDNGVLFRGGAEKKVRTKALDEDFIDCVILLPEKLFYNTGAPGAVMIFNKDKPDERRGKVLFINASGEYEQHPDVRKLNRLGDEHINKIVKAYQEFSDKDGFSRVVSLDEIKGQDYNLNVTLYVFPREEIEDIDILKEWRELQEIENKITKVESKMQEHLRELELLG